MMLLLLMVAMAASSEDPITILINYGGLVAAFVLLIVGRLHTTGEITALNNRISSLERTIRDRDETIKAKDAVLEAVGYQLTNRTVPALTRTSEVLEAIPQSESALAALLRQSLHQTAQLTDQTAQLTERLNELQNQRDRDDSSHGD